MAVSMDVGQADNVHPPDKKTVGIRLALAARAIAYGERVEYSGPLFREATIENDAIRVYFTHGEGLKSKSGELQGFEIAGNDKHYHPARATVTGEAVLVHADGVDHPLYVRYAWSNAPLSANLYNQAGLPASTFTSEPHISSPCLQGCFQ